MLVGCLTQEIAKLNSDDFRALNVDKQLIQNANKYAVSKILVEDTNLSTERDEIFMLLAYAVVYKNWQNADRDNNRGYNIGSILVNGQNDVVYWARNSVNITRNMTQHGEVRLIDGYLKSNHQKALEGYTIYSTLEPCAMCSGMMFLTNVDRVVYGQKDPLYGDAIERLEYDSKSTNTGYPPYPRYVKSDASNLLLRHLLDYFFDDYELNHNNLSIALFLTTDEARYVYKNAIFELENYEVKFNENLNVKAKALDFYNFKVSSRFCR